MPGTRQRLCLLPHHGLVSMSWYSLSTSWYRAIACSARIRRAVSVATPTIISTLVPAKPLNADRCVMPSTAAGASDKPARKRLPSSDMRVRVEATYSAVCLPGRMPGMAAPVRFSCSLRSLGSSCRQRHWEQRHGHATWGVCKSALEYRI
eukprot:GHRQ01026901.1.p1 GENE.GHRQ01026901.1~~GHRQ01026901.1.p1  ORF type:complete len:150 (-),score=2.40 GHRQ01026901.1:359-808(-)